MDVVTEAVETIVSMPAGDFFGYLILTIIIFVIISVGAAYLVYWMISEDKLAMSKRKKELDKIDKYDWIQFKESVDKEIEEKLANKFNKTE